MDRLTVEMTPAMDAAWSRIRRHLTNRGCVVKVESFDSERLTITLVPQAGWTWSEAGG